MFIFFQGLSDKNSEEKLGVSIESIAVSFSLSCLHAILETMFLYMEAQASRTSFLNYAIVCFNGRFGWVPFSDYLLQKQEKISDEENNEQVKKIELDFSNIVSNLCINIQVEF